MSKSVSSFVSNCGGVIVGCRITWLCWSWLILSTRRSTRV